MFFYIIGNGFDLHHNMTTSYSHYRKYLEKYSPEMKRQFEACKYINLSSNEDLWSDVEKALELSYEDYFEESRVLYPDISDEHTPGWEDISLNTHNDLGFIASFTGESLRKWISSVVIPSVPNVTELVRTGFFVSFNYTHTLEYTYHIDPQHIFHIHGDVNSDKLVFGCPNNDGHKAFNNLNSIYANDEWYSLVYKSAINEMVRLCDCASKNCKSKYDALTRFVEKAKNVESIDKVVVMGHKFNGVDIDYYKDVLIPMLHSVVWEFYAHGDDEREYQKRVREICEFALENKLRYEINRW